MSVSLLATLIIGSPQSGGVQLTYSLPQVPVVRETIRLETCNFAQVRRIASGKRLIVRTGPGVRHAPIDSLSSGRMIYICNEWGPWLGVVYSDSGALCARAGLWHPLSEASCRSGWVHQRWIEVLSG